MLPNPDFSKESSNLGVHKNPNFKKCRHILFLTALWLKKHICWLNWFASFKLWLIYMKMFTVVLFIRVKIWK